MHSTKIILVFLVTNIIILKSFNIKFSKNRYQTTYSFVVFYEDLSKLIVKINDAFCVEYL